MVPNHTFIIGYIYHCYMNSVTYFKVFLDIVWNSKLKFLKLFKKYSRNTYTITEIKLNTWRNTVYFICDMELSSKIRSHFRLTFGCCNLQAYKHTCTYVVSVLTKKCCFILCFSHHFLKFVNSQCKKIIIVYV